MGSLSPMSTRHLPVLSVATVVHCRCGQTEKEHLLLTTSTRRMHKTRCHAKSSRANAQDESFLTADAIVYARIAASMTADRVAEIALDLAAGTSRMRAERMKILEGLPADPLQTLTRLAEDIRRRPLPQVDVAGYLSDLPERIAEGAEKELGRRPGGDIKTEEERENALPDIPSLAWKSSLQEAQEALRADIARTRQLLQGYKDV